MSKLEEHILSCANSLVEWRLLLQSEAASPTPPSHHQSRPGSESGLTARDFLEGLKDVMDVHCAQFSNCDQNSSEPLSGGEGRAGAECCRCGRSRVFPLLSLLGFPDVFFFAVLTKALWCGEYSTDWELGFKRGGGRSGWGLEANLGSIR